MSCLRSLILLALLAAHARAETIYVTTSSTAIDVAGRMAIPEDPLWRSGLYVPESLTIASLYSAANVDNLVSMARRDPQGSRT